jgi:hypothetical protein
MVVCGADACVPELQAQIKKQDSKRNVKNRPKVLIVATTFPEVELIRFPFLWNEVYAA